MSLQGEWATGARVESEGSNSIYIQTPVCRASFLELIEAKSYRGGKPRYGTSMIFNRNPAEPAAVDVNSVLIPSLIEAASRLGLAINQDAAGFTFGVDRDAERIRVVHIGQRFKVETGQPMEGYTPWSVWMNAYKQASASSRKVKVYDESGKEAAPDIIKSGDYVRCVINPYRPEGWNMMSIGLSSVQLVAEGPAFAGDGDPGFSAVPGATPRGPAGVPGQGNTPTGQIDFSKFRV